jgi:hypothetical protein
MGVRAFVGALAVCVTALVLPGAALADAAGLSPHEPVLSGAPSVVSDGTAFGISEVRIGPAVSNLELPFWSAVNRKGRLDSFDVDVFFSTPLADLFELGTLRPDLGGVINLGGYESMIHAGLDWHVPLGSLPFYAEAGAGIVFHNGYLDNAPPGFHDLGCRTLLNWKLGAGWNVSDKIDLTLQWEHASNYVFACTPNAGLNSIGLIAGWKF